MKQKRPTRTATVALAIAALGVDLSAAAPADVRLIPAGEFRAKDGRPVECPYWVMAPEDGARIVAEAASAVSALVIDYEHATLHAKKTGAKAPAAGWFKNLEWRADGLWAIGVDWTALAAQEIADKAYRYISPVFSYDKTTGRVQKLFHAALTNDPGLDGLTDLAALAADFFQPTEVSAVNEELLEQLRWLLNLPVGTTAEEIATHLGKLIAQLQGGSADAAASFDLAAHLSGQAEQITALSAQVAAPDPAKFVPIATLAALQAEHSDAQSRLAALQADIDTGKLNKAIEDGKGAGKLTPAMEAWARDLGKKDFAALTAFIEAAPVVVKPGETQTGGAVPNGDGIDLEDSKGVADLACQYQAEQAAKGITVTTVQAVAHITKTKGA